ncbi:MAG: Stf0 family sulfotransferase [Streptosporangiaceae bacterium]
MRPAKSCLLCSLPRSGSWLLGLALEDTGLTGHPYPFFCPRVMDYCAATFSLPSPPPVRAYLDAVFSNALTPNGVFGAKVEWSDLLNFFDLVRAEWPAGTAWDERQVLEDLLGDVRIVYLERRDKVREAVSFWRALETGEWARPAGTEAAWPDGEPDFGRLDEVFDILAAEDAEWKRFFRDNGFEPLIVTYEDCTRDEESFGTAIREILDFTGVSVPGDFIPPKPQQERQSDGTSEDIVQRYRARRAGMDRVT